MTYIYLFKAPDMMYAGQHRCPDTKDPMKDCYMGSGREWCDYLDENGWHKIKEFRKHVERIILEVIYEDDRDKVGDAEKKWIAYIKENYPDATCNISKGSKPSWQYDTTEEAIEARKVSQKACYQSPERKAKKKAYDKVHNQTPEGKATHKRYNQSTKGKQKHKINQWAYNHDYPNPKIAKFPKGWNEEDKQEYARQWKNHEENKNDR